MENNSRIRWQYLLREAMLIMGWVYIVIVAGTITGLINFRIHLFSTLLGTLVIGIWMFRRVIARSRVHLAGIEWGVSIFLGTQFLSAIYSWDSRRSISIFVMYCVFALIFYYLFDLLRQGWSGELIEKTLLITTGIVVGLALFEYGQIYVSWKQFADHITFAPRFDYRLYAVFGDANLLAGFLNLMLPVSIGKMFIAKKKFEKLLIGALILGIFCVVFFTSSRGGILAGMAAVAVFVVGWLVYVSESARKTAMRVWRRLLSRLVILGLLVLLSTVAFSWALFQVFEFGGSSTHAPLFTSRTGLWGAAWKAFLSSPWVGIGPGIYPSFYLKFSEIPPDRPFLHAHSVPLNMAAESGLIGLAGLIVLVVIVARRVWVAKEGLSRIEKARWVVMISSLTGAILHAQVDNFVMYPSVSVVVVAWVAILLAQQDRKKDDAARSARYSVPAGWFLLPGIFIIGFMVFSLRAYAASETGISAAWQGDWQKAEQYFNKAVRWDPSLAHYHFEQGYAQGVLAAQGDPDILNPAMASYERGLALEPNYALHYANLAALNWQAGNADEAIVWMSHATRLTSSAPIFWLNLGIFAEADGQFEVAYDAYSRVLSLSPEIAGADFWEATSRRREALETWGEKSLPRDDHPSNLDLGKNALEAGQFNAAENYLAEAWAENDQVVAVYLALAELAWKQENLAEAEGYLRAALWIQNLASNAEKVYPLLRLAEITLEQGASTQALIYYQQVYESVSDETIYGWGTKGWDPYAWFVFQRRSLPVDILPQLERLPLPPDLVERLMPLAALYEAAGEYDKAGEVAQFLTEAGSSP